MPGDGALPVWEIQREAARRGLDVIAITNHNDNRSFRLARATGQLQPYPIVIPGQELTTGGFHMAAIGVRTIVDPYLPAHEAIARIHAQGGVAIAAHPVSHSWTENDSEALRTLDGSEMAHPLLLDRSRTRGGVVRVSAPCAESEPRHRPDRFHRLSRRQSSRPVAAPISSSTRCRKLACWRRFGAGARLRAAPATASWARRSTSPRCVRISDRPERRISIPWPRGPRLRRCSRFRLLCWRTRDHDRQA